MTTMRCPNCHGHKILPQFRHIDGGICFQCGGSGVVEIDPNAKPMPTVVRDRAWYIWECSRILSVARSHYTERGEWLDMADEEDAAMAAQFRRVLAAAPADVATRARAALRVAIRDARTAEAICSV